MTRQSDAAPEFRNRYLVDRGSLLRAGGRRELLGELARLRDGGQVARLLLLPRGEDLALHRGLWNELGLDERTDLLLLFNGDRWEARGWELDPTTIASILDGAEADLRVYYARGLSLALRTLAQASPNRPAGSPPMLWLSLGGLVMAALAVFFGLVVRRRMRLTRDGKETFETLLASARSAFAEVMLQGGDLALYKPSEAEPLQLKAAEFEKELIAIEREVETDPQQASSQVTRDKIRHLQDEFRVLTSTILQKRS